MTSTLPVPTVPPVRRAALPPVAAIGAPRVLLGAVDGTGVGRRVDLAHHRHLHGARPSYGWEQLVAAARAVRLLGRGGAAFPVADKLAGVRRGRRTWVVVNGSEGEPASWKDRVVMRLVPHLVVDGALAVADALGTTRVVLVVEDPESRASLHRALAERLDAAHVTLREAAGTFVGGEVRAVVQHLDGRAAVPPGRPVLPTVAGVGGAPTFASNVETFAQLGLLVLLGPGRFAHVGSAAEPGTTLVTAVGDVAWPGVIEVPTGLPVADVLGVSPAPRPFLLGGYHGTWVGEPGGLRIERPGLRAAGLRWNAGVLARVPERGCALAEVASVGAWLAEGSSGQCGPCVLGLPSLATDLRALLSGHDVRAALERRGRLLPGRGACAHPDGAAGFTLSALDVWRDEVATHLARGTCGRPYLGALPLPVTGGAR